MKNFIPILSLAAIVGLIVYFPFDNTQLTKQDNSITPVVSQVIELTPAPTPIITPQVETKLLFGGDTMLARTIGEKIEKGQSPFVYVQDKFNEYDYVILNLECVIAQQGTQAGGKLYTFKAPLKSAQILKDAGVDIVSLANNHSMDFGSAALVQTLQLLERNNIPQIGGGENIEAVYKPLIINKNGNKIALFAFNAIENNYTNATYTSAGSASLRNIQLVEQAIHAVDKEVDLVIPFVHWGSEYQTNHNLEQENFAKAMINAGADLIVGAHPHVKQDVGEYAGIKIYYSLGNFVFDQMPQRTDTADEADLLEVIIRENKIDSTNLIPVTLNKEGIPEI